MITPPLYQKYFIDKQDERENLFEKLSKKYSPKKGIYPGSFVHITPSFYIENMVYIDSDKRVKKFFEDKNLPSYINERKQYEKEAKVVGIQGNYERDFALEEGSFDIMFSFYAGFISQSCKKYLKEGAILVCNNSHGDASLAFVDVDYTLEAVVKRNTARFSISESNLEEYFQKKSGELIDVEKVKKSMRGEGFTKTGFAYIFRYKRS